MHDLPPQQVTSNIHGSQKYHLYSSTEKAERSILFALARPYGTYDKVYHKLANICTRSNNTNNPIFGPVGMGMKQIAIEHVNETK
mmetsp:Transcript_44281/g.79437  ORF Transcript_44281/g.79437 Transcript_44281/m.79437 type:complete len:85 (+) Transcript_44281:70-324(+)